MSWSIVATGPREAVRKHVEGVEPTQAQQHLAKNVILEELSRPAEDFGYSEFNGVSVEASGHSSPQGQGWNEVDPSTHKSGALSIKITPIKLCLD